MDHRPLKTYQSSQGLFNELPAELVASDYDNAEVFLSDSVASNLPKNAFKIYVCDTKPSFWSDDIKNVFDAWVIKGDLSALSELTSNNLKTVLRHAKLVEQEAALSKIALYDGISASNCEMIKDHLHHSVVGIRDIFQEQVRVMRDIHDDIKENKINLFNVRDTEDPLQKESLLDESITNTDDILTRADSVINAMYGFVSILQCEDRISQILDGIQRAILDSVDTSKETGIAISPEKELALREQMVKLYTIQEQRDFALGKQVEMRYCEAAPSIEDSEALFF